MMRRFLSICVIDSGEDSLWSMRLLSGKPEAGSLEVTFPARRDLADVA